MFNKISQFVLLAMVIAINSASAQWTRNNATGVTYLTTATDKVGIGTSNPAQKLSVYASTGVCSFFLRSQDNSSNVIMDRGSSTFNCLVNYKTAGAFTWYTGCKANNDFSLFNAANDRILTAQQGGNVGIGTATPATKFQVVGNSNFSMDQTGNVPSGFCINATSMNSLYYPGISLNSSTTTGGAGIFGITGVTAAGINVGDENGIAFAPVNATAFNVSSDRRMKKNIVDISPAMYAEYMEQIRTIESATFLYTHEDATSRPVPHIGVIAQTLPASVQAHISETASKQGEGRLGVSLADMQGLLLVGVKSLDAKQVAAEKIIDDQQKQIDDLRAQLSSMQVNDARVTATVANRLYQNQPNPFNQTCIIRYSVSTEAANALIVIRDLNGNAIKSINAVSGNGQVTVQANELKQGTYTYSLEINGVSEDTKLMVVTR